MTAASLGEIPFPSTETNVIKLADRTERARFMPRDTCLGHHVPDIQLALPVALPLPGCYYQPSYILTFSISVNRCSKIKPHLLDNVLSFLCCLGLFGLQSPKTDLNCWFAYSFNQSGSQSYVCVCESLPLK